MEFGAASTLEQLLCEANTITMQIHCISYDAFTVKATQWIQNM